MTDYSRLKVVELKAELKRRGIPQTGLKLKQNYIDRLLEADAQEQTSGGGTEEDAPDQNKEGETAVQESLPAAEPNDSTPEEQSHSQQNDKASPVAKPQVVIENDTETVLDLKSKSDPADNTEAPTAESIEEAPEELSGKESGDATEDVTKVTEELAVVIENDASLLKDAVPDLKSKGDTVDNIEATATEPNEKPLGKLSDSDKEIGGAMEDVTESAELAEEKTPAAELPDTSQLDRELSTSVISEITEDTRKRKRRNHSPPYSTEMTKKAKVDDGNPHALLEQAENVEPPSQQLCASRDNDTMVKAIPTHKVAAGFKHDERTMEDGSPERGQPLRQASVAQIDRTAAKQTAASTSKQDARFKDLFPKREQMRPASPERNPVLVDDRNQPVVPALHRPTSALYIRDLMRPLQPSALKNYLISIASSSRESPNATVIREFFLDSVKTHCLVSFASVSAASRVRSAMHGTVWPNERDRKSLWVDFVPEEKLGEWIDTEQRSSSQLRGGPRWEVVYDETDNGMTEAALREVQASGHAASRGRDIGYNPPRAPLAPRGGMGPDVRRDNRASEQTRSRGGEGFKALDDLFSSTRAKPKLYYLPVPSETANRRLNRFVAMSRSGPHPRPGGDEMRRYTFESTDLFVDRGPEYGHRASRGGRGGGGSSWRGRG